MRIHHLSIQPPCTLYTVHSTYRMTDRPPGSPLPAASEGLTQDLQRHLAHVYPGRLLHFTLVGGAVGGRECRDGERRVPLGGVGRGEVDSFLGAVDVFVSAAVGQQLKRGGGGVDGETDTLDENREGNLMKTTLKKTGCCRIS